MQQLKQMLEELAQAGCEVYGVDSARQMLALAEKRGQALRKCHDCGRPTVDFRCPPCRAKWRAKNGLAPMKSVFDEEDYS